MDYISSMWEDVIAGVESTAVETMTLHRDLSGFSILEYQSDSQHFDFGRVPLVDEKISRAVVRG